MNDREAALQFKELRDKCIPGPWMIDAKNGGAVVSMSDKGGETEQKYYSGRVVCETWQDVQADFFIAARACDLPERVLRLAGDLERLEPANEKLAEEIDRLKSVLQEIMAVSDTSTLDGAVSRIKYLVARVDALDREISDRSRAYHIISDRRESEHRMAIEQKRNENARLHEEVRQLTEANREVAKLERVMDDIRDMMATKFGYTPSVDEVVAEIRGLMERSTRLAQVENAEPNQAVTKDSAPPMGTLTEMYKLEGMLENSPYIGKMWVELHRLLQIYHAQESTDATLSIACRSLSEKIDAVERRIESLDHKKADVPDYPTAQANFERLARDSQLINYITAGLHKADAKIATLEYKVDGRDYRSAQFLIDKLIRDMGRIGLDDVPAPAAHQPPPPEGPDVEKEEDPADAKE